MSSLANNSEDRSSTGVYYFLFSGCLVCWRSRKQRSMARSSTKGEYFALSDYIQKAIWLKYIFRDLGFEISPVVVYEGNLGAMELRRNPKFHNQKSVSKKLNKKIPIPMIFSSYLFISNRISIKLNKLDKFKSHSKPEESHFSSKSIEKMFFHPPPPPTARPPHLSINFLA